MFMAGMETTSTSLKWTFLFLIHHPEKQLRVHEELDAVIFQALSIQAKPEMYNDKLFLGCWKGSPSIL